MRRYHSRGVATVGTEKVAVSAIANTTTRLRIYDLIIGSTATPADQATNWAVQRSSADGTGTAFTPIAIDPADPAALGTSKSNYSSPPTLTANSYLFQASINQRATFRWVAAPDGEFVVPQTSGAGLNVLSVAATGSAVHEAGIWWQE